VGIGNCFIENDYRISQMGVLTKNSLTKKYEAMLPREVVDGKSVLDLGSHIGTGGAWCLANGARSYTGVEINKSLHEKSKELLSNTAAVLIHDSIERHLLSSTKKYDVVVLGGVLFFFDDPGSILLAAADKCDQTLCIDYGYTSTAQRTPTNETATLELLEDFSIKWGDKEQTHCGVGSKASPQWVSLMLKKKGFIPAPGVVPVEVCSRHDT